jgi:hypothetical protein
VGLFDIAPSGMSTIQGTIFKERHAASDMTSRLTCECARDEWRRGIGCDILVRRCVARRCEFGRRGSRHGHLALALAFPCLDEG